MSSVEDQHAPHETANAAVTPEQAVSIDRVISSEIHEFEESETRRRHQFPHAALVGLLTGLIAVAFRAALNLADTWRNHLIATSQQYSIWGLLATVAFCSIGAGIGVWLVQSKAPEASGSGIPHLKAVLHRLRSMAWRRVIPVKFVGGLFSTGAGLTLGREGPTIQMGGAIGQMVGEKLKTPARERRTLMAAGAGAGLASAFNAPLSGMVFVLEEVQRDFTPTVFTAAFVACVVADVVARLLVGQNPVFHVGGYATPEIATLPIFLLLGVLCGALGVVFNRSLLATLRLFDWFRRWPKGACGVLVGALIGFVGWFHPEVLGGGHALVERTLDGHFELAIIPLFFLLRFGLTMISYSTGAAGGFFAPLLGLGAQIGLAVGLIARLFFPTVVNDATVFAVVGMGAYFTAIVRAPLTGMVLIIEMTGNYSLMLPLLVACFGAYGIADLLSDLPIYEALLERDLKRSQNTGARPPVAATG